MLARNASESKYPQLWRNLMTCWSMRDGTYGDWLIDRGPLRAHGVYNNYDASKVVSGPYGLPGLFFDGTNDYISVAQPLTLLDTAGPMSSSWWFNFSSTSGYQTLITFDVGTGASRFTVTINQVGAGKLHFEHWISNGVADRVYTAALTTNRWYHLACVRNSDGTKTIYLDGKNANAGTQGTPGTPWSQALTGLAIGRPGLYSGQYYGGSTGGMLAGDICVWSRAITLAEVQLLAAGKSPLDVSSRMFPSVGKTFIRQSSSGNLLLLRVG